MNKHIDLEAIRASIRAQDLARYEQRRCTQERDRFQVERQLQELGVFSYQTRIQS